MPSSITGASILGSCSCTNRSPPKHSVGKFARCSTRLLAHTPRCAIGFVNAVSAFDGFGREVCRVILYPIAQRLGSGIHHIAPDGLKSGSHGFHDLDGGSRLSTRSDASTLLAQPGGPVDVVGFTPAAGS